MASLSWTLILDTSDDEGAILKFRAGASFKVFLDHERYLRGGNCR